MMYFFLVLALLVVGCTSDKSIRGHPLETEKLSRLDIGEATKQDVISLFGTPTSVSIVTDNLWYYIGQRVEKVAFFPTNILEATTVVMRFDDNDVLQSVQNFDQEDFQDVQFAHRETVTKGHDVSFLEILLGNLGVGGPGDTYSPNPRNLP